MAVNSRRAAVKKTATRKVAVPKQVVEPVEVDEMDYEEAGEVITELTNAAIEAHNETSPVELPFLTLEQIQRAPDRTEKSLTIEEWKGRILIRSLSAKTVMAMLGEDNEVTGEGDMKMDLNFTAMQKEIIMAGVVQPVITESGYNILMEKSAAPFLRIFQEIMLISNLKGIGATGEPQAVEDEVAKFRESEESE
ncbi:hypothetical protein [Streptomyces sp. NPDC006477]|uniref:hypothetical protein n=1 Tax=Streptomyces sp. NPDC006477 TaxID=3364747 RepID=UPI0036CBD3A2